MQWPSFQHNFRVAIQTRLQRRSLSDLPTWSQIQSSPCRSGTSRIAREGRCLRPAPLSSFPLLLRQLSPWQSHSCHLLSHFVPSPVTRTLNVPSCVWPDTLPARVREGCAGGHTWHSSSSSSSTSHDARAGEPRAESMASFRVLLF